MYIHVPAAWIGLALYVAMAIAAGVGLVARHALADVFCVAAAPVGAVLVAICLITGSIWGKPTWGAWWVWDARLTSVLILFLLYCGYIVLRGAFDDHERGGKAGAILLLAGAVNIPIVRFSVDWWHTLHQPASVLRMGGPPIAPRNAEAAADHGAGLRLLCRVLDCCACVGSSRAAHRSRADDGRKPIKPALTIMIWPVYFWGEVFYTTAFRENG